MEFFEVAFFSLKNEYDEKSINVFNEALNNYFSFEKQILIEPFNEEDTDYIEIILSIEDLHITKDNFFDIFKELSDYVSVIFKKINTIRFATGIYELTYDYIKDFKYLSEFTLPFFEQFPIIFFRQKPDIYQGQIVYENESVICIYNKNVQDIF